jgi:hypothetical protein
LLSTFSDSSSCYVPMNKEAASRPLAFRWERTERLFGAAAAEEETSPLTFGSRVQNLNRLI